MRKEFDEVVYAIPLLIKKPGWTRVKRKLFTPHQCDELVRLATERGTYYHSGGKRISRDVDIRYLYPDEAPWAYEKLSRTFAEENIWNFALTAIVEPMRIQRYRKGGYTKPHSDFDYKADDQSKITAILPLVSHRSWRGGTLSVTHRGVTPALDKGDCLLFPSFAIHGVSRVTQGSRVILSAWVAGPRLV